MILTSDEVQSRIESPNNLINQLRSRLNGNSSSYLPVIESHRVETEEVITNLPAVPGFESLPATADEDEYPEITDLVSDASEKIKRQTIKQSALDVLNSSLDELKIRLAEATNPKDLSRIASDMGKIIDNLTEKKDPTIGPAQVVIYKPTIALESHYETVIAHE